MKHDEHFLSRLERLDREHAEIALGLYFDSALVKHVLRMADIPDNVERVALCLGTPEQGPFIIVTRDGHFVTCLGEGMQLQAGQPLISRHRLDTISESVSSLRSLVADARAGNRSKTRRKLERVFAAGCGLSQQEFEELARWLPLLAIDFLKCHIGTVERCNQMVERLSRHKKLRPRDDELLYEYWCSTWLIAHLTMLLGSDGGATLRRMFEVWEPDEPGLTSQLAWCLIRMGVTSFAARGTWIASKLPSLIVPACKRRYLDPQATFLTTLTDSLSLAAAGLRHRKYQAEVRKTLDKRIVPYSEGVTVTDVIRNYASIYFEQHTINPQPYLQHTIDMSRALVRGMFEGLPEADLEGLDRLPEDIAVAMFMSVPISVHGELSGSRGLFERLPWIVRVEAKSFYLPEPLAEWLRIPWTRYDATVLLDARKQGGVMRQEPIVAAPKPGRNEPCPCGSGKKYKRCCGGPGQATNG